MQLQFGDDSLARTPEAPGSEHQLRMELDGAVRSRAYRADDLEATVRAFTVRERAAGAPPEKVLVQLKSAVAERAGALPYGDRSELTDWVVHWAIDAYYRAD